MAGAPAAVVVNPDLIGWVASAILLLTLTRQIHKQAQSRSSEGLSSWLFLGQIASSAGFLAYAVMLDNWVFVVTNSLLLVAALIGEFFYLRDRGR